MVSNERHQFAISVSESVISQLPHAFDDAAVKQRRVRAVADKLMAQELRISGSQEAVEGRRYICRVNTRRRSVRLQKLSYADHVRGAVVRMDKLNAGR
jgi:hypothetical protein